MQKGSIYIKLPKIHCTILTLLYFKKICYILFLMYVCLYVYLCKSILFKSKFQLTDKINLEQLDPYFPQLIHNRVHLDDTGELVWPVILVYPEYQIMDYIQEFKETNM